MTVMRAAVVVSLVSLGLTGHAAGRQVTDPFATADAAIRAEMDKAGIPGAAVAVVVGDRVAWTKGFGVANVETGAPVTPDTLFQIGSITKSFTAAALLTAASEGALALDKPVRTYVSGLTPCVGLPTLTQLLSHTGGLIDEPDEFGPQGEDGLGAYQRTWTSEYCMLAPGRAFSYSNSGFALAGLALQEVDKKPFADAMKARVLAPLGMTRTTFRPTEAMTWPLAVGHRKTRDGKMEVVRPLPNDARLWPAGTLYSTANEVARFVSALTHDGKVDGKQALPPGVADRMRTAQAEIPTTHERYGQGLFVSTAFGHGGTMTGYAAQMSSEDNRGPTDPFGIVVLTNGDQVNPAPLVAVARVLALEVLRIREGNSGDHMSRAIVPPLTAEIRRNLVGTYRNPRRFTVEVAQQGDTLVLKRFGREFPMRPWLPSPRTYVVDLPRGGTETIAFGFGRDGRADYLQMNLWALARVPDAEP